MNLDFYARLIESRFRQVKTVIAICSGKGGVGKTFIATCLAQALRDRGFRTGLLDLDIHGFTTHRVLGLTAPPRIREEETPPTVYNIVYFSPAVLVEERPLPLHGLYREKAILDILSCVKWPELDYLVVDMPPGFGDEVILPLRYLRAKANALIVATRDALSINIVERLVSVLESLKIKIIGLILNFSNIFSSSVKISIEVLYEIPFIECVPEALTSQLNPYTTCRDVRETFLKLADLLTSRVKT